MKSVSVISKYLNYLAYSTAYEQNRTQKANIFNTQAIEWFLNLNYLKDRSSNFQSFLSKIELIKTLEQTPEDILTKDQRNFILKYKDLKSLCLNFKKNHYGESALMMSDYPMIDLTLKKFLTLNDIIQLLNPSNDFLKSKRKYLITIGSLNVSVDFTKDHPEYFVANLGKTTDYEILTSFLKEKIRVKNKVIFSISIMKEKLGIVDKLKQGQDRDDLFFIDHQAKYLAQLISRGSPREEIFYALSALGRGDSRLGEFILQHLLLEKLNPQQSIYLIGLLLIQSEFYPEQNFVGVVLAHLNKSPLLIKVFLDHLLYVHTSQKPPVVREIIDQIQSFSLNKIFHSLVENQADAVILEWIKTKGLNQLRYIFSTNILFEALRSDSIFNLLCNHMFHLKEKPENGYFKILNHLASDKSLSFLSSFLNNLKKVTTAIEYQDLINEALFYAAGNAKKENCTLLREEGAVFGYEKTITPIINYLTIYLYDKKQKDFGVYLLENRYIEEMSINTQELLINLIQNTDESLVAHLLKIHQINVNFDDRFGLSPLDLAIDLNSIKIVKLLMQAGADPYRVNRLKSAPILKAHKNDINIQLIRQLTVKESEIILGMNRLNQLLQTKHSLMQIAVERNSIALVSLYHNYGFDVNELTSEGIHILELIEDKINKLKMLKNIFDQNFRLSAYEFKKEFRKMKVLNGYSFFKLSEAAFNDLVRSKGFEIQQEINMILTQQGAIKQFIQEIVSDKAMLKESIEEDEENIYFETVSSVCSNEESLFKIVLTRESSLIEEDDAAAVSSINKKLEVLAIQTNEVGDDNDDEVSELDYAAEVIGSKKPPVSWGSNTNFLFGRDHLGALTPTIRK